MFTNIERLIYYNKYNKIIIIFEVYKATKTSYKLTHFIYFFCTLFLKTGFLCVVLDVLELTL